MTTDADNAPYDKPDAEWGEFWRERGYRPRGALMHDWNDRRTDGSPKFFSGEVKVGQVFSIECEDMVALGIVESIERGRVHWKPLVIAYDNPDEGHKYALWAFEGTYLIGPDAPKVIEASPASDRR